MREWDARAGAFDLVVILYLQMPGEERRVVRPRRSCGRRRRDDARRRPRLARTSTSGTGGPQEAARALTPEEVAAELDGLEIEKAERVLRPVEGERDAIDTLVRASRR